MAHRHAVEGAGAPRAWRRPAALALTVGLHVLLAALVLWRRPERAPLPSAGWIDMIQVAPTRPASAPPAPAPVRTPKPEPAARARPQAPAIAFLPAPPAPEPARPPAAPDAATARPDTFALAIAAAGKADQELRRQFPERALTRIQPLTAQQKLAEGIAAAVPPPRFYEAPRITAVQDQGVGWGRRIEKVQTAFGTYCVTYESNHGGDGRDVFKDALQPKIRKCPREK